MAMVATNAGSAGRGAIGPAEQTRRHVARQRNIFPRAVDRRRGRALPTQHGALVAYVVNTYGVVFETIQSIILAYGLLARRPWHSFWWSAGFGRA